ncbi:MAG: hypothetical protein JW795_10320 [Chitinivibrionales bacterium]|nr:hypothetical protein [Chitinivibrionales bacterium]
MKSYGKKLKSACIGSIILLAMLCSCYFQETNPVAFNKDRFGMRDTIFIRTTGEPRIDSLVFSMAAPTDYVLKIQNGPPGYYRVAAATIFLNGVEIFSPCDFNPHVAWLEKKVSLQKENVLTARLRSKPGSAIGFGLKNDPGDTIKPYIEIVEPLNNAFITTPTPTIRIKYYDRESGIDLASLCIKINGVDRTVYFTKTDSTAVWSIPENMSLSAIRNSAYARISDKAGNVAETTSHFQVNFN